MSLSASSSLRHIGVGIDTARYGHQVTFLREDRGAAAPTLSIRECREGYQQLAERIEQLERRHPGAHFHIRLDAAGTYATNLEAFLRELPMAKTISVGEPRRNVRYREAHFPKRKPDTVDSHATARFAVVEQPRAAAPIPPPVDLLREVTRRLEGQVRQTTRTINRLHNLLSRVFPELSLVAPDLAARSVLQLLKAYPSPRRIAAASTSSLAAIPYLTAQKADAIQQAARHSVGSLQGPLADELVRQHVLEVLHSQREERKLEKLLERALVALPSRPQHLGTIPGVGRITAAVLIASIVSIDRFETPERLVSYFGIFPEEASSGVQKTGQPYAAREQHMSRKGNDLVRKYLWHAARTGARCNPAIRSCYARARARGKRGDVALGHCMRKLLHLVFAIWKTGKPFDGSRYAISAPATDVGAACKECDSGANGVSPEAAAT